MRCLHPAKAGERRRHSRRTDPGISDKRGTDKKLKAFSRLLRECETEATSFYGHHGPGPAGRAE
jgi:hypothetical protein